MAAPDDTPALPRARLSSESERNVEALRRALQRSHGFSLHLVIGDALARAEVGRRLAGWSTVSRIPELSPVRLATTGGAVTSLAERLAHALTGLEPEDAKKTFLIADADALVREPAALDWLNVARDRLGEWLAGPLVLLLSDSGNTTLAERAPDLFDVRAATYRVAALAPDPAELSTRLAELMESLDKPAVAESPESLRERTLRLAELERGSEPPPAGARADEWLRIARGWLALGDRAESLAASRAAEKAAKEARYDRALALALATQSRATSAPEERRGLLDRALAISARLGDPSLEFRLRLESVAESAEHDIKAAAEELEQRVLPVLDEMDDDSRVAIALVGLHARPFR